jgi:DNA phosphorothioation-associated putative methyltransferase
MIARDRTAIRRSGFSRPIRTALNDGVVSKETDVFDYGCGHGDDVRHLLQAGIRAFGWDPAHVPDGQRNKADVVNLGYVVNVIENPEERAGSLRDAWICTGRLLIVSARLTSDMDLKECELFEDGYVTRFQTFQKFFEQQELREWLQEVLGETPVAAAPGIFYVFRFPDERERFVASRYRRRIAAPRIRTSDRLFEEHQAHLQYLMTFVIECGRLPEPDEIDNAVDLTSIFGSIRRAFQVIRRVTGTEQWESIANQRRTDLLVYVALGRFPRRPAFSSLPRALQRDIKALFRTYKSACSAGDALLFDSGDVDKINAACVRADFGKLMPTALYVHTGGLSRLDPLLRVYEGCARVLSGSVEGTTIVKLRRGEPKVSYLSYPHFDQEAHPQLTSSVRVDLRTLHIKYRDFSDSANPPVLHRKEQFVPQDYPDRDTFARLTQAEELAGLLADGSDIGTREGWLQRLKRREVAIRGHELIECSPQGSA